MFEGSNKSFRTGWAKVEKIFDIPKEIEGEPIEELLSFSEVSEYNKELAKFLSKVKFDPGGIYKVGFEKISEGEGTNLYM